MSSYTELLCCLANFTFYMGVENRINSLLLFSLFLLTFSSSTSHPSQVSTHLSTETGKFRGQQGSLQATCLANVKALGSIA